VANLTQPIKDGVGEFSPLVADLESPVGIVEHGNIRNALPSAIDEIETYVIGSYRAGWDDCPVACFVSDGVFGHSA
jgi:hypothetical protein